MQYHTLEGARDATTRWYVTLCKTSDIVTAIVLRIIIPLRALRSPSNNCHEASTRNGSVKYAAGLAFRAWVRKKRPLHQSQAFAFPLLATLSINIPTAHSEYSRAICSVINNPAQCVRI